MPNVKYSQETLDQMIGERNRLGTMLKRMVIVSEGGKTEFWKEAMEILKAKLESAESSLDQHEKLTDVERIAKLEERKQIRFFMRMPENFTKALPNLRKNIEQLNRKINAYGNKLERG